MNRQQHNSTQRSTPSKLRIIGGRWRNTRLSLAADSSLRPTPERLRETLFNWLAPSISGVHCLDAFAGSGALGLEALSRGAAGAVFLEQDRDTARRLRQQIEKLQAAAQVRCTDSMDWLERTGERFDLVFLDPPFASDLLRRSCHLLSERGLLNDRALIYCELGNDSTMPELPADWQLLSESTAGAVRGALYRKNRL